MWLTSGPVIEDAQLLSQRNQSLDLSDDGLVGGLRCSFDAEGTRHARGSQGAEGRPPAPRPEGSRYSAACAPALPTDPSFSPFSRRLSCEVVS
jgi:hypothetical protein